MYQPTISYTDARRLVAGGAQLVDVRNPMEHQRGALPGSVNIPLPLIQQALKQLDRETPVLLYCNSGQRGVGTGRGLPHLPDHLPPCNCNSYTTREVQPART